MVRRWTVKPAGSSTLASHVNAPPSSGVTLLQRINACARATGSGDVVEDIAPVSGLDCGSRELGVGKAILIQHCSPNYIFPTPYSPALHCLLPSFSGPTASRIMIFCQIFCDRPAAMRSISLTASVISGSGKPWANSTATLDVSDSISEQ